MHLFQKGKGIIELSALGAHVHATVVVDAVRRQSLLAGVVQLGLLHPAGWTKTIASRDSFQYSPTDFQAVNGEYEHFQGSIGNKNEQEY